ncbi:MAG: MFS transporter [Pseudotabrizicola sp.]|uniref:MFS transporter n=1 Tax=Pseudotabrizicola sp. TaxID=2939647 RepID=UPI00273087A9|nr:MFS transporter [Pseudotabrizicola sp.]MDP2082739.1 MFS transporter [Pseudotabrizicola sp.]MDZ7576288.1 MFS transporter [Pseudotabrizicola sp.]
MRAVVTVLAVWCAGLGAAAQFGKISVLFEALGAQYSGASAVALGLIVSIVGIIGLVFGTTAGLFVARIGPRRAMVAALVMGAAMSAVQSVGLTYGAMIASRVVEGVSHLAIVVVGPTVIAGLAAERFRGLAMTLWSSFFGVTYAVLALLAPPLIAAYGTGAVFVAHAVWMAAMGICLWGLLPRDPLAPKIAQAGIFRQHVAIYASPRLSAPAMGFFCYTFLYVAVLTLVPPDVPLAQRALTAAGMPLISIAVSLTLGVWLLSRMSAVRLVQWGYLIAVPGFVVLALFWGRGMGMVAGALWVSAALGVVQGASFASIPELNQSAQSRAQAAGAIAQLGNLGTTTGTPVLAALLLGAGPWGLALVAGLACALGIVLHSVQARRRARMI